MALDLDDTEEIGGDAPRPIHAESVANGAFERLGEGQGAVATKRGSHQPAHSKEPAPEGMSKRALVALVVGVLLAIALAVFLFVRVFVAPSAGPGKSAVVEQTEVGADEQISYRGVSYELVEDVQGMALVEVREASGGQRVVLGNIPGAPVALILFDGSIVIPENLPGGTWDVLAYTIGSGWTQIMDQNGNAQAGTGTISQATLDGSTLRLVVDGAPVEVPLTW